MKIIRTTDADLINRLIIDSGQRAIDLSFLSEPRCCALVGEPSLGTHICVQVVEGVWEFHSAVLPEARGEWTVEFTDSAIRFMFCATDCIELITRLPQGAVAATALARRFGFSPRWVGGQMVFQDRIVPFAVWSLTLMEWMPAEEEAFGAVLMDMFAAGQDQKARVWLRRRDFVARKVDA